MKMIPNPEYEKAPFEQSVVFHDGKVAPEGKKPLRFSSVNITEVMNAMQKGDFTTVLKLAIPPFIEEKE